MQYSDEIIRQEIKRYSVIDSPVNNNELERWKESFVNLDNDTIKEALEYISGRSYYWSRLTASIDMPQEATVDEVMTQIEALRMFQPQFEIGIQIAMRMLGKPLTDSKIERLKIEDSGTEPFELPINGKPKAKAKKKRK